MSDGVWVAIIGGCATVAAAIVTACLARKRDDPQPAPKPVPPQPTMESCYGRWTWQAEEEAFELELRPDGSFLAKAVARKQGRGGRERWKGTWHVRNGSMFLAQTHYRTEDAWESNYEVWLEDEIAEVSATAIRFAYGGVFESVQS